MAEHYQLSGAGNDFLALVEPGQPPSSAQIYAWCRRGVSIGADGLFTLERLSGGARMVYFNADGGRERLCLNGCRCAALLAFELGWAESKLELTTDAGTLHARRLGPYRIAVTLPPIVDEPRELELAVGERVFRGWSVCVGVPHFVLPWPESLARAPVAELGPALRSHPDLGTEGTNVDFVRYFPPSRLEIRSFERGVEAETLACGTGVVAAARAGLALGQLEPPISVLTTGGFELEVERLASDIFELAGDARILLRAELLPGAAISPAAAVWEP